MEALTQLGNIPIDINVLKSLLVTYAKPANKIEAMVNDGTLIRLKRGLFVVSPKISGQRLSTELIANHIYGPSYVSMESALRYYGLIPESVYLTRSMTLKRSKEFNGVEMTKDEFIEHLKNRLATTDIELVKSDVKPFIKDHSVLDIWSNDYFLQLVELMKFA